MKSIFASAVLFFALALGRCADSPTIGNATDFVSNQYFDPPNQQKVKVRISGSSATPTPDNKAMVITDLRIERFKLNGEKEVIITAPQCTYAFDGIASSPGHLEFETGDGKIKTSGDGFLWRQSDNSLTISNNVYTRLKMNTWKISLP